MSGVRVQGSGFRVQGLLELVYEAAKLIAGQEQESYIARELEHFAESRLSLQLPQTPQTYSKDVQVLASRSAPISLSDVRRDRNCTTSHLPNQSVSFVGWKRVSDLVEQDDQLHRFLPRNQISEGAQFGHVPGVSNIHAIKRLPAPLAVNPIPRLLLPTPCTPPPAR